MELKKIIALTVLIFVALPSLTMVMGQETFAIEGYKYKDKDQDGVHDDGEPGVEGVTITLTVEDDIGNTVNIGEMLTKEDGYFSFIELELGTYTVTETVPDGWGASMDISHEFTALSGEDMNLGYIFGNYVLEPETVETETDLKCAIEIASNYLANIKGIVDALSEEYEGTEHSKVIAQVNDALGDGDAEGAEDFLIQAMEAYNSGDLNLAARKLAAARNILGRVNGMMNSVYKAHNVARTERFMEQVMQRIEGLEAKIERLKGRFSEETTDNANAAMGRAKGKLSQLGASLSVDNNNDVIDALEGLTAGINADINEMGGDNSDILEAIDRLEAKIRVLNRSSEKLAKKGSDNIVVDEALSVAEVLLYDAMNSFAEGNMDEAENYLGQAEGIVSEAGNNLRANRTQNKVKAEKSNNRSH